MTEIHLTDANFSDEVLKSDKPVLVDFWAEWCGPCKIQGPIIEELAQEIGDVAKIGKLEVDENPATAQQYGIMSIPTLAIFKKGEIVWQVAGVQTKEALLSQLKAAAGN
ncbi:MAG: thioredoxin [Patescibacteria group bacterium]